MSNKKVMLIEDDNFLGDLLVEHFHNSGLDVELSRSAEAGYKEIKKEIPGILLLDLLLPKMGGLELLEILKNENIVPSLPVMILSNLTQPETVEKAMNLGARDFLGKSSFDLDEITQKVKAVLAEK